jgi:TonB family protein
MLQKYPTRLICGALMCVLIACTPFQQANNAPETVQPVATPAPESPQEFRSYAEKIKFSIQPHITLAKPISGNPAAEVEVRTAPDGKIVAVQLVSSSGVSHWDRSVQQAVLKAGRIPLDVDGHVPAVLRIVFRPKVQP